MKTGEKIEPTAQKKPVSESETVAGQQPEKITGKPDETSEKLMATKTFRSFRGALLKSVSRFINWYLGWSTMQNYGMITPGYPFVMLSFC